MGFNEEINQIISELSSNIIRIRTLSLLLVERGGFTDSPLMTLFLAMICNNMYDYDLS